MTQGKQLAPLHHRSESSTYQPMSHRAAANCLHKGPNLPPTQFLHSVLLRSQLESGLQHKYHNSRDNLSVAVHQSLTSCIREPTSHKALLCYLRNAMCQLVVTLRLAFEIPGSLVVSAYLLWPEMISLVCSLMHSQLKPCNKLQGKQSAAQI